MSHPTHLEKLIVALVSQGVEMIVVGGAAAVNLSTDYGPIDTLCVLHDGRGYDELYDHTDVVEDGDTRIRILDLPTLIDVKAGIGRAKDRLVLPILLALLKQRAGDSE